jgi:excisionase family DNA binding protein
MAHRIVSIAEAARLTGLSKASIRSRLEHGELRAIRRGGLRRISVDELAERGLLDGAMGGAAPSPPAELLDRLESQAEEIGRLRVELALAQHKLEREHQRRSRRP